MHSIVDWAWEYSDNYRDYVLGTSRYGAGVYDGPDGLLVNVVWDGWLKLVEGTYGSLDEAKSVAEQEIRKLVQE